MSGPRAIVILSHYCCASADLLCRRGAGPERAAGRRRPRRRPDSLGRRSRAVPPAVEAPGPVPVIAPGHCLTLDDVVQMADRAKPPCKHLAR